MQRASNAFSLIELSIVLVILGLLVGGVLSGRSLIRSAEIKAQIEQIQQYKVAVRSFQDKYIDMPGDVPLAKALSFKLYRDGSNGMADSGCSIGLTGGCGNGDGYIGQWLSNDEQAWQTGEPHLFWLDLMQAGLIPGSITAIYADRGTNSTDVKAYLPAGKLSNQFVYVWTQGVPPDGTGVPGDGKNYITLSGVTKFTGYDFGTFRNTAYTMRVSDAYGIDIKLDDGMPQSGNTTATLIRYITGGSVRAAWAGTSTIPVLGWGLPTTAATPAADTTCYDNDNTAGKPQHYSFSVEENPNCALSFGL